MKMPRISLALMLASLLSSLPVASSYGYTECSGVLTRVQTDAGGNLYVSIAPDGHIMGLLPAGANPSLFKLASSIALAARATNATVAIRYTRDGVVCGSTAWSEVLEGIYW